LNSALGDILLQAVNRVFQAIGHFVKGLGQSANFICRFDSGFDAQIAGGDLHCRLLQVGDRAGQPAGQSPGAAQPQQNDHNRQDPGAPQLAPDHVQRGLTRLDKDDLPGFRGKPGTPTLAADIGCQGIFKHQIFSSGL